jgi:hypothetical protein
MNNIRTLEAHANECATVFVEQFSSVTEQLKPLPLLDALIEQVDPEFKVLQNLKTKTRRQPFPLLAVFTGIFVLARQFSSQSRGQENSTDTTTPVRRFRRLGGNRKGESHGKHIGTNEHR